jgi:hypothetical protein
MRPPTHSEQAALEAAFSLADAIDAITAMTSIESLEKLTSAPIEEKRDRKKSRNSHSAEQLSRICRPGWPVREKRSQPPVRWRDPQNPWAGWRFVGLELVDDAGNRYGQDEIRALFYNRRRLRSLEETLKALRPPPPPREPQQLTLALEPFWKTHATR